MDETVDKTAAINLGEAGQGNISKNAQKKADKQARLAESKANKSATNTTKEVGRAEAKRAVSKQSAKSNTMEGRALIGITISKDGPDFSGWYQQVLTKGDFLDYYDVSGCYILKPGSYFIWEKIQAWFNKQIQTIKVKNCAFPLFVSEDVLQREKAHIEGFAAEVAWVTHAGKNPLEKKIALRPTSETVMYPYYAKWIQSHRDLPLRLNQWNSVVRWEFKHPQPFLRTREFHWQEGHTAHLRQKDAEIEVRQILEFYAGVYEKLLAVPVIRGRKTDKEKFAGAEYTTTVEGFVAATGRGIQGGTSHHLGQNFSKMFGISVEDEKKERVHVYQNSWGLSTRTIGVMVMTHGDDRGLVVPPVVAELQAIIIPVGITAKSTEDEREKLFKEVDALEQLLLAANIRVESDKRDGYNAGWKFNDWELKGVPLRLEFGPKDSAKHVVTTSRRDIEGDAGKNEIPISDLASGVQNLLSQIQDNMYLRASNTFKEHTKQITLWDEFVPALNAKNVCLIPHCLTEPCEDELKTLSARTEEEDVAEDERAPSMGAKSLCIPFDQPDGITAETKCLQPNCGKLAEKWCLFGRSY